MDILNTKNILRGVAVVGVIGASYCYGEFRYECGRQDNYKELKHLLLAMQQLNRELLEKLKKHGGGAK